MSATSPSAFPPVVRETLQSWFTQYGANDLFEIECRVQDVGEAGFERLLQSLASHSGWSNAPITPVLTLDVQHASGVRETRPTGGGGGAITFLRKQKGPEITVPTELGYSVKFQVSSETETSSDPSPAIVFRHKQRYTFVHKNLFKFELTRVKQGTTNASAMQAETTFEVELEFCGQQSAAAARTDYLADSMLMKAADLLHQLSHAAGAVPAARQRHSGAAAAADGTPSEGDEITLSPGTEVALGPSGHGAAARFGGEMPAELAELTRWLFSHRQADGRAHIMSEPTRIGKEHYPVRRSLVLISPADTHCTPPHGHIASSPPSFAAVVLLLRQRAVRCGQAADVTVSPSRVATVLRSAVSSLAQLLMRTTNKATWTWTCAHVHAHAHVHVNIPRFTLTLHPHASPCHTHLAVSSSNYICEH